MASIILFTIGALFLVVGETIFLTAGLISIGVVVAIEIYNRVDPWKFMLVFIISSLLIDAYFNFYLGTYYISIVVAVLLHSTLKRIFPYDRKIVRFLVLLVSFTSFHIFKNYFIAFQLSSLSNLSFFEVFTGAIIRGVIETVLLFVVSYLLHTYFGRDLTSVKVKV